VHLVLNLVVRPVSLRLLTVKFHKIGSTMLSCLAFQSNPRALLVWKDVVLSSTKSPHYF
jgi:hypothetical protein